MAFPRLIFLLKSTSAADVAASQDEPGSSPTPYYPSSGLEVSAEMLSEMLQASSISAPIVKVADGDAVHAAYVAQKAELAIIEALWVTPAKFDEIYQTDPTAKFVVRLHSQTPFLAQEGIGFDWTLQYLTKPNVIVGCNAQKMFEEVTYLARIQNPSLTDEEVAKKVVYLPNYYETSETNNLGPSFKTS